MSIEFSSFFLFKKKNIKVHLRSYSLLSNLIIELTWVDHLREREERERQRQRNRENKAFFSYFQFFFYVTFQVACSFIITKKLNSFKLITTYLFIGVYVHVCVCVCGDIDSQWSCSNKWRLKIIFLFLYCELIRVCMCVHVYDKPSYFFNYPK